ncbi:MAG: GNAT family N-acetyltransferase [Ruminococcus sp.]|nr:GNAT family N-acetyltransferase [Ruminococcus sp.]
MKKEILVKQGINNNPLSINIRQTVFVSEQGFIDEFDEIDDIAWHAVLFVDEKAVATARVFLSEEGWHVGRVAVLKEYRKQGLGEEVMNAVEQKAKELGAEEILLSAQLQAKGFYEKIGYECYGEMYYDQHCPHVAMKKKI